MSKVRTEPPPPQLQSLHTRTDYFACAGDSLMRGKRYGQLMIFSDIAATMTPPPFAIFCIDADVLTGWRDVDAMITTMEGILLFYLL